MQIINVGAQKIDDTILKTLRIVVAAFLMTDQADKIRFFEKIFLVANASLDVILKMLFFTLTGVDINFSKKKLW